MVHRGLCDSQMRNLHSACVHGVVLALRLCRVLPPPYTLQGMDTWLRGIPRACVAMRRSVSIKKCVVLCVRSRACERAWISCM